jgi:hypothetical protein
MWGPSVPDYYYYYYYYFEAQQQTHGPPSKSSVAEGQQDFHLHTSGFEPKTF